MKKRGLIERLETESVICAEGFLFEAERRGYLASGEFVPELALENPEALKNIHIDFQHAGSDVVEAFTYNGHREKMRVIGKEDLLEPLNRAALKIAKEVADNPGAGKENDLLFSSFPNKIKALQWHSYEVTNLEQNKDITLLASSSSTKYQIFKYQNHAYGIQFHIEVKDTTVNDWACVVEYKTALEEQLGKGALEKFDKEAKSNMFEMNNCSKILYSNFKRIIK